MAAAFASTEAGETLLRHALTIQRDFERLSRTCRHARHADRPGRLRRSSGACRRYCAIGGADGSRAASGNPIRSPKASLRCCRSGCRTTRSISPCSGFLRMSRAAQGLRLDVLASEDMVIAEKTPAAPRRPPSIHGPCSKPSPSSSREQFERVVRQASSAAGSQLRVTLGSTPCKRQGDGDGRARRRRSFPSR